MRHTSFASATFTCVELLTWMLHFAILCSRGSGLLRTQAVCPSCPVSHDTFLYLCSLDTNEQNVALDAFRAYMTMYVNHTWINGSIPFTDSADGRNQPEFILSTKGCSYRSDFNAGAEAGDTDYKVGIEFNMIMTTNTSEELFFKVFRALPEWNATTDLGSTTWWVFEGAHLNNGSAALLHEACTPEDDPADCVKSRTFPTWTTTIPAFYPG